MIEKEKFDKYKKHIVGIMENDGITYDEENIDEIVKEIIESGSFVGGNKGDKIEDNYYFVTSENYIANKRIIDKAIDKKNNRIYVISSSLSHKIKKTKKAQMYVEYIGSMEEKTEWTIEIDSRLNSVILDNKGSKKRKCEDGKYTYIKGQVFVAKLKDIISLYEDIGEDIFKKNVRIGINKDNNKVEEEILRTLENEPENFWFYNNGITMIANDVIRTGNNRIKIEKNDEISVINGAQTITASAKYFYDEDNGDKRNQEMNAYVMLRVINVINVGMNEKEKIAQEQAISISLNRQKPIDPEDLAIFNESLDVLKDIAELLYDNKYKELEKLLRISLLRKGENESNNSYTLFQLARYILSSKNQKPGEAKNANRTNILKIRNEKFVRTEIFPSDIKNFKQYINEYGLVNISSLVASNYIADVRTIDDEKNSRLFKEESVYIFIALLMRAVFSYEQGKIDGIDIDKLNILYLIVNNDIEFKKIVNYYEDYIKQFSGYENVTYSQLKQETIYNTLLEEKNGELFKEYKNKISNLISVYEQLNKIESLKESVKWINDNLLIEENEPSKNTVMSQTRNKGKKVKYIVLKTENGTEKIHTDNTVDALKKSVAYVFGKAENSVGIIDNLTWISRPDTANNAGMFEYSDIITILGEEYILATKTGTDVKINHLNNLIKEMGINDIYIQWYDQDNNLVYDCGIDNI